VIEAPTQTAREGTPRLRRVWQIVLIVVAVQAVLVLLGTVAFSALGLADQPTCGGG
jgi:amino acid transporter